LEIPDWTLFVWFLKGQWETHVPDTGVLADFRMFDVTFTPQEMRDGYRMLVNHAQHKGML
jgi:hypothetical protein